MKSEKGTERDGFLSYSAEFHALIIGLGVGFVSGMRQSPEIMSAFIAITIGIGAGSGAYKALKKGLKKLGKNDDGSAISEIRREPWYAIGGSFAAYASTIAIDDGVPAVSTAIKEAISLPLW